MSSNFKDNCHQNHWKTKNPKKMPNRIKMVENPLITELNLGESLIEIKKAAFIFENSGDPDVLDELLTLIKNLDIPVLISELHIPYEAEA